MDLKSFFQHRFEQVLEIQDRKQLKFLTRVVYRKLDDKKGHFRNKLSGKETEDLQLNY